MLAQWMCKSKNNTEGVLQKFYALSEVQNEQQLQQFYTAETLYVAKKLHKQYPETDVLLGLDKKIFDKDAKWEKLHEERNGDETLVTIQIIEHPVMNMKGVTLTLKLHYEGGSWKIDRAEDLKRSL
jgi:hypothetical protein